jgi:hypothetical protein
VIFYRDTHNEAATERHWRELLKLLGETLG